jgi:copper(I)-binding protein
MHASTFKEISMTSVFRSLCTAAAVFAACVAAHAQVTVKDAWVRATVPQQKSTAAFMKLTSATGARLVSVSTPLTPVAEVHEMAMQDNVMRMRRMPALELPAGTSVELTPGGYHVMLLDLPQQVKAGDTVPLTLVFEGKDGKRETQQIAAPVRALNAAAAPGAMSGDHKH